jgi:PAS domain S-box-containing protein
MKSVETLTTHAQGQNGNSATPAAAEASGRPLEFIEFFNHTSDIVLTIDSAYRITAANDAARTTLPLHWGKIPKIGSSVLELFPAHEHTRLKALYDSMLRGEPAERQHLEMVSPNGNLQHYEVTYYLLNAQPDSSTRIAMFMRNVTDLYEIQRKQREDAEHALHQTKEQFYKTANTVPGMIYQIVFHPDGTVSYPYVSEGCRALYGVNPEDVMRDASILTKMWHPDDIGEYMRRVEECRRTLKPFDMECRIVLPDGTIKWLRVNSVPEPQTNGSLCFYGIRTDITAQKQTEAILNQQRIQMNAAADLAKLAFYESQTQTLFLNDRYFALLGTTAEQEGGYTMSVEKYLGKFVLPEDVPVMLQHMQNVLSNPTLMRGETMYRIRRLDNGQIRYLKAIFNVERNAEGAPVRLFGPIQDVTEQEEALLALRQQQLQMNAAADLAKMAFWEVDMASSSFIFNERCYALIGTTAEQEGSYTMSVEKYLGKFVLLEDVSAMIQHLQNVLSNPTLMRGETMYRIRRPDNGQIRYIKVIYNVERNSEGIPVRLFGPIQDVTEQEETLLALRQSEEKFRKTVNTIPSVIYQLKFNPDGSYSYPFVSENCKQLYEVSAEEAMRDASILTKMWHPDDVDEYWRQIRHTLDTLTPLDIIMRIITPSGKVKWVRVNSNPELQPDGSIVLYGVRTDITAQKQAEAVLNQQRLQMNAAADLAQLAFWETDMASSSFIFNDRCFALIGTSFAKEGRYDLPIDDYLSRFVLPEDVPAMLQHLQKVLSDPTLSRGQAMYRIRRPDNGQIRYIKVIYNVERNSEGIPVRLFGPIQDVTEQEETLLALRQSEEKFRTTVSSIPGMVYEFTVLPDGTMAMPYVSEGCRDLFGVEPEAIMTDLMGVWSSLMHPDDIAAAQVAIAESAANLSPFVYEARFSLPTGKTTWTRFYGKPVKQKDGTIVWYGVCVDISQLKALESELKARLKEIQETQKHLIQSEKMSALGQMVAGIAHELNTPIGYASNNVLIIRDRFRNISSLLRKALEAHDCIYSNQLEQAFAKMQEVAHSPNGTIAELDETIRRTDRLFAGISSGFEQMANLVKSMRNFSRLDEAEMKKADINEGLRSCLLMIGHQFKDKNIELITEYGEIPMVDCFPAQLNQVFLNLIANAIHAVEEKPEGKIHVSSALEDGYVMVRVKDNGKGIPKHIQDKIFDPFFTTKPVGKGTGLGLSICYNIVQKHKGRLYFETTEGVGTTFIVKIPAVDFLEA